MTRILVVDDEPQIVRALSINLRARQYDVDTAPDETSALRAATRNHPRPPRSNAAACSSTTPHGRSTGGSPGDWIELVNTGTAAIDVSGWIVKDDNNSHTYKIGTKTSIAAGAFLALDVESSFGLGSSDSARLFQADGSTLADSYVWTDHAATTFGRCADGTGAFSTTAAPTKGAPNACGTGGGTTWPGGTAVTIADASNVFGENLSGLSFESEGVLWAVDNGPGRLYRLVPNGATWRTDPAGGWASGKALHYAGGSGDPDAEGVVVTPTACSSPPSATTATAPPACRRSCASTPPRPPPR
jgi:CheY-like chemotaxis protein